jgi:hypothetical protein
MLGLYNRYPMSKEEIEDLIRREFLAMLFEEDEREIEDSDPNEVTSSILENLLSIRSTLIPKIGRLASEKVEELWSEAYKAKYRAKTGQEVNLETGNTWYPDFMPKTGLTSGFMEHLVGLKVEYDIAQDKAMAEYFKNSNPEETAVLKA